MDELTPDELNALCDIPEEVYAALAREVIDTVGPQPLVQLDRAVLARWYATQEDKPVTS